MNLKLFYKKPHKTIIALTTSMSRYVCHITKKQNKITKLSICIGWAFATTLVLFYIMSVLIKQKQDFKKKGADISLVDFIRTKPKNFLNERRRNLPKKKPKDKPPPRLPLPKTFTKPKPQRLAMNLPDLKLSLKGSGPALGGMLTGHKGSKPLFRIQPEYPIKARLHDIEGYVRLRFDVTAKGTTTHIRIIEAKPRGVFERSAIRAIRKWKYPPEKRMNEEEIIEYEIE